MIPQYRITALTAEGIEITPQLSDHDLKLAIEYHAQLLDAAVAEANRRWKESNQK